MSPNRIGPEEAAAILGLTVAQLLERASDGDIPGAMLTAAGWHFPRRRLEDMAAKRVA